MTSVHGEVTELRRRDVSAGVIRVRRAVVYSAGELHVKAPKSGAGRRNVHSRRICCPW